MAANTFGNYFRVSTFGESHGKAMGGIIDGCPSGLKLNIERIQKELDRRRPGQSKLVSSRNEPDRIEFLSGISEGVTLGTPIGFIIRNKDHRPEDYDSLKNVYRPSHADYTWEMKFGIRESAGGGRSSARETVCRVAAGAVARLLLEKAGITITAWVKSIGEVSIDPGQRSWSFDQIENSPVRCPDPDVSRLMEELILKTGKEGDTLGGVIECHIAGVPAGWGAPVFDKLDARLAYAMMGINAVKGFEIGSGFKSTTMKGSQHNDPFIPGNGEITTASNHAGGILGGISSGNPITFRVAFKPVATLMKDQPTVTREGKSTMIHPAGRHDVCVVPRAVPIVEAMAALVLADFYLEARLNQL